MMKRSIDLHHNCVWNPIIVTIFWESILWSYVRILNFLLHNTSIQGKQPPHNWAHCSYVDTRDFLWDIIASNTLENFEQQRGTFISKHPYILIKWQIVEYKIIVVYIWTSLKLSLSQHTTTYSMTNVGYTCVDQNTECLWTMECILWVFKRKGTCIIRNFDYVCNDVSHWLGANLESAL